MAPVATVTAASSPLAMATRAGWPSAARSVSVRKRAISSCSPSIAAGRRGGAYGGPVPSPPPVPPPVLPPPGEGSGCCPALGAYSCGGQRPVAVPGVVVGVVGVVVVGLWGLVPSQ